MCCVFQGEDGMGVYGGGGGEGCAVPGWGEKPGKPYTGGIFLLGLGRAEGWGGGEEGGGGGWQDR